jgi:intraflagellar transport protein 74
MNTGMRMGTGMRQPTA